MKYVLKTIYDIEIDMKNLIFAGLAKNCHSTLEKNVSFLENFKREFPNINLIVYIFESDSTDGTKEYLNNLNSNIIKPFHENNLDEKFIFRTEKISYCRNFLLEQIRKDTTLNDIIYIPLDLDIEIFKFSTPQSFFNLIKTFIANKNIDAVFPFGYPYYYDIHALRASGWNTRSPWEVVSKINKYLIVGKLFTRYFVIYRKQKRYYKKRPLVNVDSAFGGIGLYKVNKNLFDKVQYSIDLDLGNYSCEHTKFNSYFSNKFIDSSWKIPSPNEHIEFKLLKINKKIGYFFTSIISDIKKLF